jgi:4-amino-4-deoxy-L-arabinose transferase-like glycosyltransferase
VNAISTQSPPASAPGPAAPRGRAARLLRARAGDPAWARPALLVLLVATALLYMAGLSRNGWANDFYSAAVEAGTRSWKAFLFGSFDSSNFITVDKPPAFLWIMELSARIFGLNYWSLLVPQALEGVATVGLLYTTVRRWFGPPAALAAGVIMALTPVATLMFRFDDPDALLVLTMTAAAYAVTRAIESGRTRWLVLAGALLGFGFLAKMLAAFLVLPGLALAYLWAGPPRLGTRIWQLLAGGVALLVAAGWWVAAVLLTPAASRPYIGSTTDNNILQLTFGYNGLGRLDGGAATSGGGARFAGARSPFGGGSGITRLFGASMGGQISWLLPAALAGLVVMLWVSRRFPRTDRTRAAALLWGGWLLVAGLIFSFMSGITHSYYTIALAPPIAALAGTGAAGLWRIRHTWLARGTLAAMLAVTGVWAWVLLGRSAGWYPWLRVLIAIAALGAAAMILTGPKLTGMRPPRRAATGPEAGRIAALTSTSRGRTVLAAIPVSLAVLAGLLGPLAYSAQTAASAQGGSSPSAGPAAAGSGGFGGFGGGGGFGRLRAGSGALPREFGRIPGGSSGSPAGGRGLPGNFADLPHRVGSGGGGGFGRGNSTVSSALTKLLVSGAPSYRWAAATDGSMSAAPLELAAREPVMAIGGFSGADPAPTLAAFQRYVADHDIHYFIARGGAGGGFGGGGGAGTFGGGGFGGRGGSSDGSQITSWVEAHFTEQTVGGETVYNLTSPTATS